MFRAVALILLSITLGIVALLLWRSALNDIGGFDLTGGSATHQFFRLFGQWKFWLGILPLVGVVLISLDLWSNEDLSQVVPLYSLSYVVIAIIGKLFLGEEVTAQRWIGITAVLGGVFLIVRS
jgi:hypothetical protein